MYNNRNRIQDDILKDFELPKFKQKLLKGGDDGTDYVIQDLNEI